MKKHKITVDELVNKFPNKYELAISCGKLARIKLQNGVAKSKVMDIVFEEVMEDKIKIEEN